MFDKNSSRAITMSGLFILKVPAGQQPYLGFSFKNASKTTTMSGLLKMPPGQQIYMAFSFKNAVEQQPCLDF